MPLRKRHRNLLFDSIVDNESTETIISKMQQEVGFDAEVEAFVGANLERRDSGFNIVSVLTTILPNPNKRRSEVIQRISKAQSIASEVRPQGEKRKAEDVQESPQKFQQLEGDIEQIATDDDVAANLQAERLFDPPL